MSMRQTEIESLKAQIDYMRENNCPKLADILAEDLQKKINEIFGVSE